MEALICTALIFLAYFFGRWDGKRIFKKHRVSVIEPGYMPDEQLRKQLMERLETELLINELIKHRHEDGFIEASVEFYVKEEIRQEIEKL